MNHVIQLSLLILLGSPDSIEIWLDLHALLHKACSFHCMAGRIQSIIFLVKLKQIVLILNTLHIYLIVKVHLI